MHTLSSLGCIGEVLLLSCEWGANDCKNQDLKCHLCFTEKQFYDSNQKVPTYKKVKQNKRPGSFFEAKNSNANNELLIGSKPTPNSGAGIIKGDEQISGLIHIMEELKEQNSQTSRGTKTFTIQKAWLEKLKREAQAENKEFYYLKFVFGKEDIHEEDYYVILESDMIMSMVKTLWEDRKTARFAKNQIDIALKRKEVVEAENVLLQAKISLLETELSLLTKE